MGPSFSPAPLRPPPRNAGHGGAHRGGGSTASAGAGHHQQGRPGPSRPSGPPGGSDAHPLRAGKDCPQHQGHCGSHVAPYSGHGGMGTQASPWVPGGMMVSTPVACGEYARGCQVRRHRKPEHTHRCTWEPTRWKPPGLRPHMCAPPCICATQAAGAGRAPVDPRPCLACGRRRGCFWAQASCGSCFLVQRRDGAQGSGTAAHLPWPWAPCAGTQHGLP